MSESGETAPEPKKRGSLAAMRIADLKAMAGGIGIPGADGMRKAQLVEAIKAAGTVKKAPATAPARTSENQPQAAAQPAPEPTPEPTPESTPEPTPEPEPVAGDQQPAAQGKQPKQARAKQQQGKQQGKQAQQHGGDQQARADSPTDQDESQQGRQKQNQQKQQQGQQQKQQGNQNQGQQNQGQQNQGQQNEKRDQQNQQQQNQQNQQREQQQNQQREQQQRDQNPNHDQQDAGDDGDDGTGSRRSRRRRGRDNREPAPRGNRRNEPDTQVLEDDVLVPAAGILDVLENYAFVRTSGYLPGTEDVYLSLSLVRKFGLRRGDAVKGQVRQPREGERREKFNPMVRIDGVNAHDPDDARTRPEFDELTAEHPSERIRLETGPDDVVGRVLDVAAPIGKGQRCLVRASPRSGRTAFLKSLAHSVTASCPEAHLMVLLLHERPEEITDFEREVEGEVIASSFDHQPADHVGIAELALERAKRLVELGHDVVLLVDGLTRLARAHNHAGVGGGGRMLPGGVDASALLPPKRLFGAARATAEGGSLTVVATASVDTGAATDELVIEELEGTANAEVRLTRALADAGLHPAVDLRETTTRHEDRLLGAEELDAVRRLRRTLGERPDAAAALGLLLERVGATRTNIEMLSRVGKS